MDDETRQDANFSLGFVLGQTDAYIEQVRTGAKLAAQLGCSAEHGHHVVDAANRDGCETIVEDRGHGRVSVWIFRQAFVRGLIRQMAENATPLNAVGVWAMGKLFGYSDAQVGAYLQAHGLVKSD